MAFLNISVKNKKGVLDTIDRQNYFKLGNSDCARLDLYSFLVALGNHRGYASELEGTKDSFVREEYVKGANIRFAYSAIYFDSFSNAQSEIEHITETDRIFPMMDKYANTGFQIISDYMQQHSEQALAYKLIAEMDTMYEQFLRDNKGE